MIICTAVALSRYTSGSVAITEREITRDASIVLTTLVLWSFRGVFVTLVKVAAAIVVLVPVLFYGARWAMETYGISSATEMIDFAAQHADVMRNRVFGKSEYSL